MQRLHNHPKQFNKATQLVVDYNQFEIILPNLCNFWQSDRSDMTATGCALLWDHINLHLHMFEQQNPNTTILRTNKGLLTKKNSPTVSLSYCVHNNKKEVTLVGEKKGWDTLFPAEAVGGTKKNKKKNTRYRLMRKSEENKLKSITSGKLLLAAVVALTHSDLRQNMTASPFEVKNLNGFSAVLIFTSLVSRTLYMIGLHMLYISTFTSLLLECYWLKGRNH